MGTQLAPFNFALLIALYWRVWELIGSLGLSIPLLLLLLLLLLSSAFFLLPNCLHRNHASIKIQIGGPTKRRDAPVAPSPPPPVSLCLSLLPLQLYWVFILPFCLISDEFQCSIPFIIISGQRGNAGGGWVGGDSGATASFSPSGNVLSDWLSEWDVVQCNDVTDWFLQPVSQMISTHFQWPSGGFIHWIEAWLTLGCWDIIGLMSNWDDLFVCRCGSRTGGPSGGRRRRRSVPNRPPSAPPIFSIDYRVSRFPCRKFVLIQFILIKFTWNSLMIDLKWTGNEFGMRLKWIQNSFQIHLKFLSNSLQIRLDLIGYAFEIHINWLKKIHLKWIQTWILDLKFITFQMN